MVINIVFFIIIIVSAVRTISYGIYAIKDDGIVAGISVFTLAAASLFTGIVILCKQILQ